MKKTIIKGTGRHVPSRLVTNEDLALWMETSDEWIIQRTGIEQRYWIPEEGGVGASDLGLEASKIAMDRAGWKAEDIDLIIFATLSPDLFFPGSGCLLAHKLGLTSTPALDIRQQCTGFLYGMATADAYIRSSLANGCSWWGRRCTAPAWTFRPGAGMWPLFSAMALQPSVWNMWKPTTKRPGCWRPACTPMALWRRA